MTGDLIRQARKSSGLTMQALAERVGTTAPQISRLEKGERRVTLDWLSRLANALEVDPRSLIGAEPSGSVVPADATAGRPTVISEVTAGPPLPVGDARDLIPVRGAARGGDEQEMFLDDGPIDYIRRPPSLQNVRGAYSLYLLGDSMAPRFRAGQLLHVNPHRVPQTGSGVAVYKKGGAVIVKEFVERSDGKLTLRQYNPARVLEIPGSEIIEVHAIVGLDEP